MGKVKVELSNRALRQLATPLIKDLTEQIAAKAGEGFAGDVVQGKTRPHGLVRAIDRKAYVRNMNENVILKAAGATHV